MGRSRFLSDDAGTGGRADAGGGVDSGPRGADAGPGATRPPDVPGGATRDYVVSLLQVAAERPSGSGLVPGFDLDAHETSAMTDAIGCGRLDFTAPARFGGARGVDNQIGLLLEEASMLVAGFDADVELEASVTRGGTLLLVRLVDVGDAMNDGHVEVLLYLGRMAGPMAATTEMITWEGEPHVALTGGQHFTIDPRSVTAGDLSRPLIAFRDAWIEGGRLRTAPGAFTANIALTGGSSITLSLAGAQLAFDLGPDRLSNGVVAGNVLVDEFARTVITLAPDAGVTEALVRTLVAAKADIDRDGTGPCEAISLGLVLEGRNAIIDAAP